MALPALRATVALLTDSVVKVIYTVAMGVKTFGPALIVIKMQANCLLTLRVAVASLMALNMAVQPATAAMNGVTAVLALYIVLLLPVRLSTLMETVMDLRNDGMISCLIL
ncbi:hypothetical protein MP228_006663 [Amoeboaphelidium protococcarum]|nr:hypothetical protein MP228_006663 [Amoeboaphelidium protococcarum]